MKYPRIDNAIAIDNTTLVVKFSNQEIKKYDIRRLWDIPMFLPLKQPAFFKNFQVEPGGYAIVWNENIDISEHELWTNGITLTDSEYLVDLFDKQSGVELLKGEL